LDGTSPLPRKAASQNGTARAQEQLTEADTHRPGRQSPVGRTKVSPAGAFAIVEATVVRRRLLDVHGLRLLDNIRWRRSRGVHHRRRRWVGPRCGNDEWLLWVRRRHHNRLVGLVGCVVLHGNSHVLRGGRGILRGGRGILRSGRGILRSGRGIRRRRVGRRRGRGQRRRCGRWVRGGHPLEDRVWSVSRSVPVRATRLQNS
jgi:hypothetical protein